MNDGLSCQAFHPSSVPKTKKHATDPMANTPWWWPWPSTQGL